MTTTMMQNAKPVTIMLVDDDDGDAKAIHRAFSKAKIGNTILRAVDGIDAFNLLHGTQGDGRLPGPFIFLVDINMPRMNGIEFVKALRQDTAYSSNLVFMLTTSKREEDKQAVNDLNVAGYIVKETAGEDFMNLITLIDCYWRIVELSKEGIA